MPPAKVLRILHCSGKRYINSLHGSANIGLEESSFQKQG